MLFDIAQLAARQLRDCEARTTQELPTDCGDPTRIVECVGGIFPEIEFHNHVLRAPNRAASELVGKNISQAPPLFP